MTTIRVGGAAEVGEGADTGKEVQGGFLEELIFKPKLRGEKGQPHREGTVLQVEEGIGPQSPTHYRTVHTTSAQRWQQAQCAQTSSEVPWEAGGLHVSPSLLQTPHSGLGQSGLRAWEGRRRSWGVAEPPKAASVRSGAMVLISFHCL